MASPAEIYEFIFQQGQPSVFLGDWLRLPCSPDFVDLKVAPAFLLAQLLEAFALEDLVTAGVVVVDAAGTPTLAPALIEHANFLFALRKGPSEIPSDLVAGGQLISRSGPSYLALFDAEPLRSLITPATSAVYVVFSQSDLAVCWALGLAAITGNELLTLSGKPLVELFVERLRRPRHPVDFSAPSPPPKMLSVEYEDEDDEQDDEDTEADTEAKPQPLALIVLNFDLTSLDLGAVPVVNLIREHLYKMGTFLDFDVSSFGVWKLTPEDLTEIRFCQQYGLISDIGAALEKSAAEHLEFLHVAPPFTPPAPPATLIEATQHFHAQEKSLTFLDGKQRARDQMLTWQHSELIAPLLGRSQASQDPIERNAYHQLAQLCEIATLKALALKGKLSKPARANDDVAEADAIAGELHQLLTLIDATRAISQELRPWRTLSMVPIRRLAQPKVARPASRGSASAARKSRA